MVAFIAGTTIIRKVVVTPKTISLVEDNPDDPELAIRALRKSGHCWLDPNSPPQALGG